MQLDMELDSEEIDLRARWHMTTASCDYATAVRFVMADSAAGGRSDLVLLAAGADPASLELHNAILALIEKERLAGRKLTFLEAARRIERERAAKG
jgi:hypothetical protein